MRGEEHPLSLSTPILDAEKSHLLRRISAAGGFVYAKLATLAASGDNVATEAAHDMVWEQLHSGPWHAVVPVWRDAYSMACLHVATLRYNAGDHQEALRFLDMGLIMGGNLLRKDLESAVQMIISASDHLADKAISRVTSESTSAKLESFHIDEALQVLPRKSLSGHTVERRSSLSLESFLSEYFMLGCPIIITDAMSHWPALTKWKDLEYLRSVAGSRTVPVEVGRNYLSSEWKQELITFSDFLERLVSTSSSLLGPSYLAQHPLLDQIRELQQDILLPDYCFAGGGELESLNAWFGPEGTVTPLHHDPHHNLLAQVVGKKYVRLYQASISEDLYPYTEFMLRNSSQVDLDNLDEQEFPRAQNLDFIDCVLNEGEMLYIPPKWWHYVRSLTLSFSVSFWWRSS